MIEELLAANELPARENDVMNWGLITDLTNQGLDLGAHTCNHPLLSQMNPADAELEIAGSIQDIYQQTGYRVKAFAYPGGAYNDQAIRICGSQGIQLAFTTCRGANDLQKVDPFQLRRINIGRRATLTKIQTQLLLRERWINSVFKLGSTS